MTLFQKSNDWEKCIICGDSFTAKPDYEDHLHTCIDYNLAFDFLDALRNSGVTNMFGSRPYIVEEFGISKNLAGKVFIRWTETFEARHPILNEKLLVKVLLNLDKEQWTSLEDGHELFAPSHYINMGFSEEFVKGYVKEFTSDGTPKGTIFVDGKTVKKLTGIYNLQFVEGLVRTLDLEMPNKMGRGFQARACVEVLKDSVK